MNRGLGAGDLLGIALVVDDIHKGCNLAFRYPAPPVSAAQDHVSSFHKLSAPLIAKLFRPKNALCNESFELVIDDLRFVSHPVLVPRRVSSSSAAAAPGSAVGSLPTPPTGTLMTAPAQLPTAPSPSTATTANASAAVRESDTTMFNIIFVLDEHRQQPFQLRQAADTIGDESASSSDGSATGGCDNQAQLQQHKQRIAAFRTIAAQLANGLLHEELRAGFVSREVRELLHIRDELLQYERTLAASSGSSGNGSSTNATGTSGGGGSNQSGGSGGGGGGTSAKDGAENASHQSVLEVDPQTVIDVSLSKSVLANDLKSVFHGLEASGTVHVVINHWVKLSLTLTDAVSLKMQDFRPYQTLLLLTDEDAVLNALPADHSYQLSVLIKAASPLKTFQDLALETSIPIHQLFRLAAHLVYWGFGRVVDTITMHNFYQVRPKRSLRSTSALALEFKRTFPPRELCEVLASFNGARRLGDSVKNLGSAQKMEYIHMLIWLLQRDFIMQLHRYVYFMIPPEQDAPPERERDDPIDDEENYTFAASNREYRTRDSRSYSQVSAYGGGRTIDQQPYGKSIPPVNTTSVGFSDQEKAYLDRIATTNPVFTLFRRLCVYFHGQYHLEEIMWRENVSRSELRTVLSTYQGIIVCCLHE